MQNNEIIKKINDIIKANNRLVVELGCGEKKRSDSSIGIDVIGYKNVDIVGDVYDVLRLFPENSIDQVYSYHFIEHVSDVSALLLILSKIVKSNGVIEIVVPHFSNPYFFSDPTHKNTFGLYTFSYYAKSSLFRRIVPGYVRDESLELTHVDLIFKSNRPFYIRHSVKVLVGSFFNSCNYLKEFYEENVCYLFPCHEIRYLLVISK